MTVFRLHPKVVLAGYPIFLYPPFQPLKKLSSSSEMDDTWNPEKRVSFFLSNIYKLILFLNLFEFAVKTQYFYSFSFKPDNRNLYFRHFYKLSYNYIAQNLGFLCIFVALLYLK